MSCGPDRELLRLMIADLLAQAVKDGTVQGGLLTCDGEPLPSKQKMKDCASAELEQQSIATALNELAEKDTALGVALKNAVDELTTLIEAGDKTVAAYAAQALKDAVAALEAKQIHSFALENGELVITLDDHTKYAVDVREVVCKLLPKQYHPTLQITLDDVVCGTKRIGWAYHPDDLRDPAADVQITDCDGNVMFWLYPTSAPSHNIPAFDNASNEAIGFYANAPVVAEDVCNPCGEKE